MLNEKQKKTLRGLAHKLKPVVMLGSAGLSQGVKDALEEALTHHELIKVRVSAGDRDEREQIIKSILELSGAELIQRVGHIATLYRRNPDEPVIKVV